MECVRVVCCLYLGMKRFGLSLQPVIPPKRFDIFSLTGVVDAVVRTQRHHLS